MDTTKTQHVKTLILGGGITGLATGYALQEQDSDNFLILEANSVPGGLCATTCQNGYQFDYSGHFLHLHTAAGNALVKKLLGTNLQTHTRHAFVYTNGMQVPVPFQHNVWALSPALRQVVVAELSRPHDFSQPQHFEDWCIQAFGRTLYEAFFRPYNEKLWGRKLTELTPHWGGPFIAAPSRQEILQSATQQPAHPQGYNATFLYPKTGGCGALVTALATRLPNKVLLNTPVTRVDLSAKTAWSNRRKFTFDQVVNTLPLPLFINLLVGQDALKRKAALLQVQPVTIYHLAIARRVNKFSWIYFPDEAQPFYRIGLESAFNPGSVPDTNQSLFYIELPGLPTTTRFLESHIWEGMYQKGLLRADDVKLFSAWQTIPCAYVIFDKHHAHTVPTLLGALEKENCFCAGRYGRWEYSFMESSLLQAVQLARKLA